ncbi:MAG: hypothetical protein ACE5KU_05425 [Nitrososphaerales archaeon]
MSKIISSREYLEELKGRYSGLKYREEVLKKWFYPEEKVFFDAEEEEKEESLKRVLNRKDFASFMVFFIVRRGGEEGKNYEVMNSSFKNLGGKTVTGFAHTYHVNLEYMTRLSIQMRRLEYLECVGYSYVG